MDYYQNDFSTHYTHLSGFPVSTHWYENVNIYIVTNLNCKSQGSKNRFFLQNQTPLVFCRFLANRLSI